MYLMNEDTICAPATVPGTGAISVVRVSGPEALAAVSEIVECAQGREILSAPGYSARFGRIYMEDIHIRGRILQRFPAMLRNSSWTISCFFWSRPG